MTNISTSQLQQSPYLRNQRQFPNDDLKELANQTDHAYIDIAGKVNSRTIGIYATNFPIVTGESWYINGQRYQSLRQIYIINSYTSFAHGINFPSVFMFTVTRGEGFDGTNYFPIPFVAGNTAISNVGIFVGSTNVNFTVGASPPVIISGFILLEWLSQF